MEEPKHHGKRWMDKFLDSTLLKIPESPISELARRAAAYKDVISLGRGEPDFNLPDFVKEAMIKAIIEDKSHYVATGTIESLNDAIAKKLRGENKIPVEANDVVVGAGSSPVLQAIIGGITNPGEEIILTDPTYLMYAPMIRSLNAECRFVPVNEDNNFAPTCEDIKKQVTKKTKAIMINTPANPMGVVYDKKHLEEIAKAAVDEGLLIISDEIYEKIVYEGEKHVSIASLNGMSDYVITVNGFSKSYAMTGLRVGYAAGPTELMKYFFNFNYFGHICPAVPSLYAALECMTNQKSKDFVAMQIREYDKRRKFIVSRLNEIGFTTRMPKGAFYAFSNVSGLGKRGKDTVKLAHEILDRTHVITTPGSAFGPHGEGYIRFSYATKYEDIEEAMGRIENFLGKNPPVI
jgi:aspartate/methionine/tyrosine aminotransferase